MLRIFPQLQFAFLVKVTKNVKKMRAFFILLQYFQRYNRTRLRIRQGMMVVL